MCPFRVRNRVCVPVHATVQRAKSESLEVATTLLVACC